MIDAEVEPRLTRTPIQRIARPFQAFASSRVAGAVLLLLASVVAVVWANSPWARGYATLLALPARVGVDGWSLEKPLQLWINDGLMGIFFFVVGLELKREVLAGELASARRAALPIAAALGGMIVPALLFLLLNAEGPGARGWGIPMATDIAFALGVMALLGRRVPAALKVFLTALAIVDDLGAILVIAIFYTDQLAVLSLGLGGLLVGLSVALNLLGMRSATVYFLLGAAAWLAFLESGVHATLAAVLMAMTIPARTQLDGHPFLARMAALLERFRAAGVPRGRRVLGHEQQELLMHMEVTLAAASSPVQRLERALMPVATFLVVPVFALANAGVSVAEPVGQTASHPVALGAFLGLFVGKQVGVLGAAWLATRAGLAALPAGVTWRQIHAASVLAGIGFTMSLFIGGLAYADPALQNVSKLGVLSASVLSALLGAALLWRATRSDGSA